MWLPFFNIVYGVRHKFNVRTLRFDFIYWKIYVCYRSCSRLKRCSLIASSICLLRFSLSSSSPLHSSSWSSLGVLKEWSDAIWTSRKSPAENTRALKWDRIRTRSRRLWEKTEREKSWNMCFIVSGSAAKLNFENFLSLFMTYYVSSAESWESMPFFFLSQSLSS